MKRSFFTTLVLLGLATICSSILEAQVPRMISYQGVLTDANGTIVNDGNHILTLTLYENASGGGEIYSETHTVAVVRGTFNSIIGSVNPLPSALKFDRAYFLGVSVDGKAELTPRTPMLAVPYALRADEANHAAVAERATLADVATVANGVSPTATGFVRSINGAAGDVEFVGSGATTVTRSGGTVTIASTSNTNNSAITSIHSVDAALAVTEGTGPSVSLSLVPGGITEPLIGDGAIANRKLRNGSVTAEKILDNSITVQKLNSGGAPVGATLVSTGVNAPVWGNPLAIGVLMPRADTVNSTSTLWSVFNNGAGGAGRYGILNPGNSGNALTVTTVGTGNALSASGKLYQTGGSVLFTGNIGTTPVSGPGTRMMWIPSKSAFRAGSVNGSQWDDASIGDNSAGLGFRATASGNSSIAMGSSPTASGDYSVAFGRNTTAGGNTSTSMGHITNATGDYSTAAGYLTIASGGYSTSLGASSRAIGDYSIATGRNTTASGTSSTALGWSNVASGTASTALGEGSVASGIASTAVGLSTIASGDNSFAAGNSTTADGVNSTALGAYASTAGYAGTFVYGDNSTTNLVNASSDNQVVIRASGGVNLHTDPLLTTGMRLGTGGSLNVVGFHGAAIGTTPASGAGSRMMWIPARSAFRAGYVDNNVWDDANIGDYSTAMGYGSLASGAYSVAMGRNVVASQAYATAFGSATTASGYASTAIGWSSIAFGTSAVVLGEANTAGGNYGVAIGHGNIANGTAALALGEYTAAPANYSTAMGRYASASFDGSFIYGDNSTSTTLATSASNQFMVRAAGGTMIYSNAGVTSGVSLAPGGGAWASVSDRRKKENFRQENAEDALARIVAMPVTSWNYKSQDRAIRHLGPMAQDFYSAFNLGESDTTITSTDIDGVNMLAIQALARRTDEITTLRQEVEALREQVAEVNTLRAQLQELRTMIEGVDDEEMVMKQAMNNR